MSYGALFSTKLVADGKYEEAVAKASEEIEVSPDEPEAYFNRAQANTGLERFAEALADYVRTLAMDMSASSLDPEVVDDELFFTLRTWAGTQKSEPPAAIATIERYRALLPSGRHVEDIAKWVDSFNGVQTVWVREKV